MPRLHMNFVPTVFLTQTNVPTSCFKYYDKLPTSHCAMPSNKCAQLRTDLTSIPFGSAQYFFVSTQGKPNFSLLCFTQLLEIIFHATNRRRATISWLIMPAWNFFLLLGGLSKPEVHFGKYETYVTAKNFIFLLNRSHSLIFSEDLFCVLETKFNEIYNV